MFTMARRTSAFYLLAFFVTILCSNASYSIAAFQTRSNIHQLLFDSVTSSTSTNKNNSNQQKYRKQHLVVVSLLQQQQKKRSSKLFLSDNSDDGWSASKSAMIGGAGINNAGEPPFEIRGFSLGNLVCLLGIVITLASFVEYLGGSNSETLNVSGLGFIYGIPVFLAGAALKYAEIEPVPAYSGTNGEMAFEKYATETIKKIKQDVTRHRYGDEAHLDTTVKKLGLVVPGKAYPQLRELRQEMSADQQSLIFTMVWQSLDTPYKMWADERRIKKYETFFGPNVAVDVIKIDAEQRLVGIQLTTINPNAPSSSSSSVSSSPEATLTQ